MLASMQSIQSIQSIMPLWMARSPVLVETVFFTVFILTLTIMLWWPKSHKTSQHAAPAIELPALVQIRESDGKGMGMYATRDIEPGERIIAEPPLATSSHLQEEWVEEATSPRWREIFELSQNAMHGHKKTAMGVWLTNAIPADDGEGGHSFMIFKHVCRLNHDCRPNAHHGWNASTDKATVHALRRVSRGEEITINYIHAQWDGTRKARQRKLHSTFGFSCTCDHCSLSGAELKASDERQRRLTSIESQLDNTETDVDMLHGILVEQLELMAAEGMPEIMGSGSMLSVVLATPMAGKGVVAGQVQRASEWASRGEACCRLALGADSHEVGMFAALVPRFAKWNATHHHAAIARLLEERKRAKG